jgi:hypothetical protein
VISLEQRFGVINPYPAKVENNNASKWQMGFNSAFKGLKPKSSTALFPQPATEQDSNTDETESKTESVIPLSVSLIFYPFFPFLLGLPV